MRVERVVAWFRQRPPWVADGLLALLMADAELLILLAPSVDVLGEVQVPGTTAALLIVAGTVPLAWRRVAPDAVLIAVGMMAGVHAWAQIPTAGLSLLVALYTVAAHRPRRNALQALAAVTVGSTIALAVAGAVSYVVVNLLAFAVMVALGDRTRAARLRSAELAERARELELERGERLRLAVAGERARIARELHDVAGHGVAVIAVQASGARRVLHDDPHRAAEALAAIEETARSSLTEIRQAVALLREDDPRAVPQPGLDDLPALFDRFRDAGLELITVTPDPAPAVPPAVGLAVYRVVQEALTNALKHAGPTQAHVRVAVGPAGVRVVVADEGRRGARRRAGTADGRTTAPAHAADRPSGRGFGLVGLRERVRSHGGSLRAGPVRHGFVVDARVPVPAALDEGPKSATGHDTGPPDRPDGPADAGATPAADGGHLRWTTAGTGRDAAPTRATGTIRPLSPGPAVQGGSA